MNKFAIAAGMLMLGMVLPAGVASAAPAALQPAAGVAEGAGSLVEKAQWGYCHYRRHTCARRFGWGEDGFRRCLWRHGC